MSEQLSFLSDGGGASPTSPLQLKFRQIQGVNANKIFKEFHYAKREVPILWAFGAYFNDILKGCISFGIPANQNLCSGICGDENAGRVIELNRLWMSDECPKNSESRFIAWSLRQLKMISPPRIVVSYADTKQNHSGAIYRATNWFYTGLTRDQQVKVSGGLHWRHSREYSNIESVDLSQKHRYVYFINPQDVKYLRYPLVKW